MDIDFVIPWVDGSDPAWQAEKRKYDKNTIESDSNCEARYRDWDNLRYWFRAVEAYAPWVRKVHFITWGHLPDWLNTDHQKLHIVRHGDYIPNEYLPTFSPIPIELNLHRIKDLSEHFVYFNDDVFLCKEVHPEHFFKSGLPRDVAALNVHCYALSMPIQLIASRDTGIINEHFDFKKQIRANLFKWFRLEYGSKLLRTMCLSFCHRFPGFYITHSAQPFLKSTFHEVWEAEGQILDETCRNKFRTMTDVNQWVMKEWQLAKGVFAPRPARDSKVFFLEGSALRKRADQAASIIRNKSVPTICVNDKTMSGADFEYCKNVINTAFEQVLSEKCTFER